MGSGPRAGIGEIFLPELQKGSSIMPGKVNPVIPEVVLQVGAQVIGNDTAITIGGLQGQFELNVRIPLIARNLLHRSSLLTTASTLLAEKCVDGIEANLEGCERSAEGTLAVATALNPFIGYDKAAEIVKEASASGRPLREVAREHGVDEETRQGARPAQDRGRERGVGGGYSSRIARRRAPGRRWPPTTLSGKQGDSEAARGQRAEVAEALDLASRARSAWCAAQKMPGSPDVGGLGLQVQRRVPAPGVDSHDAHAELVEAQRRLGGDARTLDHVVRRLEKRVAPGADQDDVVRLDVAVEARRARRRSPRR